MKQIKIISIVMLISLPTFTATAQETGFSSYTEKGTAVVSDNFTGSVWLNSNIGAGDSLNMIAATVTFDIKARTNWHTHATGQVLIVTSGVGYHQLDGEAIQEIQEGDVVRVPKGVRHWHGGSHGEIMSHIAIVPNIDQGIVEWMEPVTDKQYDMALASDK